MDYWMDVISEEKVDERGFCVMYWLVFHKYRERVFTLDDVVALLDTIDGAKVKEPEDVEEVTKEIIEAGYLEWVEEFVPSDTCNNHASIVSDQN